MLTDVYGIKLPPATVAQVQGKEPRTGVFTAAHGSLDIQGSSARSVVQPALHVVEVEHIAPPLWPRLLKCLVHYGFIFHHLIYLRESFCWQTAREVELLYTAAGQEVRAQFPPPHQALPLRGGRRRGASCATGRACWRACRTWRASTCEPESASSRSLMC